MNEEKKEGLEIVDVPEKMSWYMANVAPARIDTDIKTGVAYILGHSFITNHNSHSNMQTYVEKGMLYHKAIRDINRGEELFLNYVDFKIPDYMRDWCEERNLMDAGTLAKIIESKRN